MFKSRVAALAAFLLGTGVAAPAQAQFFLSSKDVTGRPVRGDEPGVLGQPMPGATPEELRAGLAWTMRAGLNVAALQCQFEPTLGVVRNYNATVADHKDELKAAFDKLSAYFVRTAGSKAAGQKALDTFNTRTYASITTATAQFGFCQAADRIGRDSNFVPRGHFGEFASERIQELRNSLVPAGDQIYPGQVAYALRVTPLRMDRVCWSRRGEWQVKKCGAFDPYNPAIGVAAR